MTTRTVSTADATTADPMFGAPVDPAFDNRSDNADMMVGADMYRRMQQRPKSSGSGYLIAGVAAIALIGGGIFLAGHQHHAGAGQAATAAISADQQAQASKSQAQTAQLSAQQSAAASNDPAQAKSVASTGNPPAVTTDTKPRPTPTRVMTRPHEAAVHHAVVNREAASASAAAAGVDASALTPPPAPVTATQPAAVPAPAPAAAAPIATPAPAPAATPTPTPDQAPSSPQSTTAPQ